MPRLSQDEMELRKEIASHVSEGNALLSSIKFSEKLPEGEAEKLKKAFAHFDEAEELSEEMGHETLHYLRAGELALTARDTGAPTRPAPGSTVQVGFNLQDCHFFDDQGNALAGE